jgi:tRNA/tmRNA/rRNA uracil-C5-methylase (TrmA/RlmC/RlmD family)
MKTLLLLLIFSYSFALDGTQYEIICRDALSRMTKEKFNDLIKFIAESKIGVIEKESSNELQFYLVICENADDKMRSKLFNKSREIFVYDADNLKYICALNGDKFTTQRSNGTLILWTDEYVDNKFVRYKYKLSGNVFIQINKKIYEKLNENYE